MNHLISGEINMDSFDEIYELFFGITEANIGIPEGYALQTDPKRELIRDLFTVYLTILDMELEKFFKEHPSLKCDFSIESINDYGYKRKAYTAVSNKIVRDIELLIPSDFDYNREYVFIPTEIMMQNDKNITTYESKIILTKPFFEIKDFIQQIVSTSLSLIEEIADLKDAVSNMNVPNIDENKLIERAMEIYKSMKKKNSNYTKRDSLVDANYELELFTEYSKEIIKNKKKTMIRYLENEEFTKSLENLMNQIESRSALREVRKNKSKNK